VPIEGSNAPERVRNMARKLWELAYKAEEKKSMPKQLKVSCIPAYALKSDS
jgi:hypothetical protein